MDLPEVVADLAGINDDAVAMGWIHGILKRRDSGGPTLQSSHQEIDIAVAEAFVNLTTLTTAFLHRTTHGRIPS